MDVEALSCIGKGSAGNRQSSFFFTSAPTAALPQFQNLEIWRAANFKYQTNPYTTLELRSRDVRELHEIDRSSDL